MKHASEQTKQTTPFTTRAMQPTQTPTQAPTQARALRLPCGGTLRYWLEGSGPPVVLIMGYLTKATAWRLQRAHLSARWQVLSFDHPGVGESEGVSPRSMRGFVTLCERLLDELGWSKVHVVGISMGGMIAQQLTLAAPERVRSLTLLVTHAGGLRRVLPPLRGLPLLLSAQLSRSGARRAEALADLLIPQEARAHVTPEALRRVLREDFSPTPRLSVRLSQLLAVLSHRGGARLAHLTLPVLIISAAQDNLIHPRHQRELAQLIPHARFELLEKAGHGLLRQRELQVSELIEAHLTQSHSEHTVSTQSSPTNTKEHKDHRG